MIITVRSMPEFRRLSTSGNTSAKFDDNELGFTGSRHSPTPFQSGKGISSSSSVPYNRTDAYKASIFSGFVASPPPVGNTTVFSPPLLLPPVYVYHPAFLCNFGRCIACTPVLAWDLTLVDYRLIQFHHDIHADSDLLVIFCLLDCDW